MPPKKKRKSNLPLVNILVASLVFHLAVGVIIGGVVISQAMKNKPDEFIPPPVIKKVQPQKLQYKQQMKQQQQKSATPRQKRIKVKAPTDISIPNIEVNVPDISADVAVGTGSGGSGGSGFGMAGGGNLTMGKFDFKFMGIRAAGQKIMIIVDASQKMVTDTRGSYPAYQLIKEEVARIMGKIPTGFLYNIGFYHHQSVSYPSPTLQPAGPGTEQKVLDWSDPVNKTIDLVGHVPNDGKVRMEADIEPMLDASDAKWLGAMIDSMSMSPDTIFIVTHEFGQYVETLSKEERIKRLREAGYTEEMEKDYNQKIAQAKKIIKQRNDARAAQGKVESTITAWEFAQKELGAKSPPDIYKKFSIDDIRETLKNAIQKYYIDKKLEPPSMNIVLFREKGQGRSYGGTKITMDSFQRVMSLGRGGKVKVIEALDGIKSVVGEGND